MPHIYTDSHLTMTFTSHCNEDYTVKIINIILYNAHCIVDIINFTLLIADCTVNIIHFILCHVDYTVDIIHCSLHTFIDNILISLIENLKCKITLLT